MIFPTGSASPPLKKDKMLKSKKRITAEEAKLRLAGLCARSEQCTFDLRRKLRTWGLPAEDADRIIGELADSCFVDDNRYAAAFARDKVRFSGWGRNKIRAALIARRIPSAMISEAIESIEGQDYEDAAARAIRSATAGCDLSAREDRAKAYRRMLARGFESEISLRMLRRQTDEE